MEPEPAKRSSVAFLGSNIWFIEKAEVLPFAFAFNFEEAIPCNIGREAQNEHERWDRNVFSSAYHRPTARRDWCLAVVRGILYKHHHDPLGITLPAKLDGSSNI
jgi:hypothetical protein